MDLIDRNKALKAIRAIDDHGDLDRANALGLAEWAVKSVPSAQPEITLESAIDYLHSIGWMQEHDRIMVESAQPEIVRCRGCKHYDTHDHRCKVWNHGVIVNGFCYKGERDG